MSIAFIAIGSNLGDREFYLRDAVGLLSTLPRSTLDYSSPWYESEPVGFSDQEWFLNGVVQLSTSLEPMDLLMHCQHIEDRLGRSRHIPQGPRTLDLDILLYDDRVIREDRLVIPHPRLSSRAFVLYPLRDIAPTLSHPILLKTTNQMCSELTDPHGIRPYSRRDPV